MCHKTKNTLIIRRRKTWLINWKQDLTPGRLEQMGWEPKVVTVTEAWGILKQHWGRMGFNTQWVRYTERRRRHKEVCTEVPYNLTITKIIANSTIYCNSMICHLAYKCNKWLILLRLSYMHISHKSYNLFSKH